MATIRNHDYTDNEGNVLFRVIRKEDSDYQNNGRKTFFRIQWDSDGNEIRNWDGVEIVPYKIRSIDYARKHGCPVFFVEGEKDVECLIENKIPATTIPGGSNGWNTLLKKQPDFADHFRGLSVTIIPDNDEPGEKFAESTARALGNSASQVVILRLPDLLPGGDVSDWFANGGSSELFQEIHANAEPFVPKDLSFDIYDNLDGKERVVNEVDLYETFVKVRSQLQKIKQTSDNSFNACCPAHDDIEPSLTVSIVNDRLLMHCHTGGCSFAKIVSAMGMERKHFFASRGAELKHHQGQAREIPDKELKEACEKILGDQNQVGEVSCKQFPPLLKNFLTEVSEISEAQQVIVASTVLASIGTSAGTNIFFPNYFDPLYPNLWNLTISQSGSFKTTALNLGATAIKDQERKHLDKIAECQGQRQDLISSGVEKDSDEVSQLEELISAERRELITLPSKGSWEGIIEQMGETGKGIWLLSEMGAWLAQMEGRHNNKSGFKASVTELYDVPSSWTDRTIGRGHLLLRDPFMAVCAVSTMEFLKGLLTRDDASTGFLARFLIFRPPSKDSIPPALPAGGRGVRDLDSYRLIEQLHKEVAGYAEPIPFQFEPNAKKLFENWHDQLHREFNQFPEEVRPMLEPFVKRWSPTCIKVSMIMQILLDSMTDEITDEALLASISLIQYAIASTKELFSTQLGLSEHQQKCQKILDYIAKREGKVARQTLMASRMLDGGAKDYDYVLESLLEQGRVKKLGLHYVLSSS